MNFRSFLADNARWLAAGGMLTFGSSFGQTYFIALFSGQIRAEFGLSHGMWGAIYTTGTLASAATLMFAGGLADRFRIRALTLGVLAGFAAICIGMSQVTGPLTLALAIYGLRFCGQGMMSHMAFTAMGRWFRAQRGRAVAISALGYAGGETILPALAVLVIAQLGWRGAWVASAAFLLLLAPVMLWLLARERTPRNLALEDAQPGLAGRHWTRNQALGHWLFWALVPGLLANPFIGTAIFFQQVELATRKGWSLGVIAAAYPLYAAAGIGASFIAAWAVDRLGARRLLPLYQLPMACAALALALGDSVVVAWAAFALLGVTQGGAMAVTGSLWPEFYGTRHIGAIRGLAVGTMIVATALGPGVTGILLDLGVSLETQFAVMASYVFAICAGYGLLAVRIRNEFRPS